MKVSDLAPNPNNPRIITPEKKHMLFNSLEEFGDLSGIVFNRKTGQLVGGHQRSEQFDTNAKVTIIKKYSKPTRTGTVSEGFIEWKGERYSYREVEWGKHKEMAANLAANKGAGEWNKEQLQADFKELGSFDVNFDLNLTMFDEEEREEFGLIEVSAHSRKGATGVDEDEVPEKAPARTQLGNIYQLGDHRLICGDATKLQTGVDLMKGEFANMVWTDPPYNVSLGEGPSSQMRARNRRTDGLKIMNDKMSSEDFRKFLTAAMTLMAEVTKPGGAIYVSHADSEGYNFRGSMIDAGWMYKQCLIWKKSSLVMGRQDYHWIHEPILYGWKPGDSHNWYSDRKQTTVLEFAKPSRSPDHPTTKPVDLVEYCLGNNSRDSDTVFDPFGGSGTTMIACEKLGRKCRMIELDPNYCDVIVERWEKYTGKKAKLLNAAPKTKLRKSSGR